MPVNIRPLFDKIMNDPDVIPEEGQDKKDIALAMVLQRATQAVNNEKALNLATSDDSLSKLANFVSLSKAESISRKAAKSLWDKGYTLPAIFRIMRDDTRTKHYDGESDNILDAIGKDRRKKADRKTSFDNMLADRPTDTETGKAAAGDRPASTRAIKNLQQYMSAFEQANPSKTSTTPHQRNPNIRWAKTGEKQDYIDMSSARKIIGGVTDKQIEDMWNDAVQSSNDKTLPQKQRNYHTNIRTLLTEENLKRNKARDADKQVVLEGGESENETAVNRLLDQINDENWDGNATVSSAVEGSDEGPPPENTEKEEIELDSDGYPVTTYSNVDVQEFIEQNWDAMWQDWGFKTGDYAKEFKADPKRFTSHKSLSSIGQKKKGSPFALPDLSADEKREFRANINTESDDDQIIDTGSSPEVGDAWENPLAISTTTRDGQISDTYQGHVQSKWTDTYDDTEHVLTADSTGKRGWHSFQFKGKGADKGSGKWVHVPYDTFQDAADAYNTTVEDAWTIRTGQVPERMKTSTSNLDEDQEVDAVGSTVPDEKSRGQGQTKKDLNEGKDGFIGSRQFDTTKDLIRNTPIKEGQQTPRPPGTDELTGYGRGGSSAPTNITTGVRKYLEGLGMGPDAINTAIKDNDLHDESGKRLTLAQVRQAFPVKEDEVTDGTGTEESGGGEEGEPPNEQLEANQEEQNELISSRLKDFADEENIDPNSPMGKLLEQVENIGHNVPLEGQTGQPKEPPKKKRATKKKVVSKKKKETKKKEEEIVSQEEGQELQGEELSEEQQAEQTEQLTTEAADRLRIQRFIDARGEDGTLKHIYDNKWGVPDGDGGVKENPIMPFDQFREDFVAESLKGGFDKLRQTTASAYQAMQNIVERERVSTKAAEERTEAAEKRQEEAIATADRKNTEAQNKARIANEAKQLKASANSISELVTEPAQWDTHNATDKYRDILHHIQDHDKTDKDGKPIINEGTLKKLQNAARIAQQNGADVATVNKHMQVLDDDGQPIPLIDDDGKPMLNQRGKPIHKTKSGEQWKEYTDSGKRASDIETHQKDLRADDSFDDHITGNDSLQQRTDSFAHNDSNRLLHAGEETDEEGNTKVTGSTMFHQNFDGGEKTVEGEGAVSSHHNDHEEVHGGAGRTLHRQHDVGWNKEHAGDDEQAVTNQNYSKAVHALHDATNANDPDEVAKQQQIINSLEEANPALKGTILSDTEKEQQRIESGRPPGPPPRPGLMWHAGIHHWVTPEKYRQLLSDVPDGGATYIPPDDFHAALGDPDAGLEVPKSGSLLTSDGRMYAANHPTGQTPDSVSQGDLASHVIGNLAHSLGLTSIGEDGQTVHTKYDPSTHSLTSEQLKGTGINEARAGATGTSRVKPPEKSPFRQEVDDYRKNNPDVKTNTNIGRFRAMRDKLGGMAGRAYADFMGDYRGASNKEMFGKLARDHGKLAQDIASQVPIVGTQGVITRNVKSARDSLKRSRDAHRASYESSLAEGAKRKTEGGATEAIQQRQTSDSAIQKLLDWNSKQ